MTHIQNPMQPPDHPRSLIGPLVLIGLGILLLLATLGVLRPGVWDAVWRLSPLLLVALGLEIALGRRTRWGRTAVFGVLALAAGLGTWWTLRTPAFAALSDHTVNLALPAGARQAELTLRPSVAELRLRAGEGALVRGQAQTFGSENLRSESSLRGDTALLRLEALSSGPSFFGSVGQAPRWDLALVSALPWTLNVSTGVGTTDLDLRDLRVRRFTLAGGVGTTTVTLPAQGETLGDVRGGVGSLTLRLPEGLAATLTVQSGVGDVQIALPAVRDGDTYIIGDPAANLNRAELEIDGGVGRIRVERAR